MGLIVRRVQNPSANSVTRKPVPRSKAYGAYFALSIYDDDHIVFMTIIRYNAECGDAMRLKKAQMAQNRSKILKAAARLFRKRGFPSVTVAEVMQAAGLTHGAFYSYFESKQDLIARTLEASIDTMSVHSAPSISEYAAHYLSKKHRDDHANGCVYTSLGAEVVRSGIECRHVLTRGLKTQIAKLTEFSPEPTIEAKRKSAITAWAAMVGALMLSRISDDEELSNEILEQTQRALSQSLLR